MKRFIALAAALVWALVLPACTKEPEQAVTYSFHGEHEYFVISNGSIVLGEAEEVFDGGDLEVIQEGCFDGIASCATTFYTLADGERHIILSNHIVDQTGGSVNINGDLGQVFGENCITGNRAGTIDALMDNLWFELKITDLTGATQVYQVQLILTE